MSSWIDKLRDWQWDWGAVVTWLIDTIHYQAVVHGPIAYVVAALIVVLILLAFPPTRGMTKTVCAGLFKLTINYIQIVAALVTVQLLSFLAKLSLTLFHKARVWVADNASNLRQKP